MADGIAFTAKTEETDAAQAEGLWRDVAVHTQLKAVIIGALFFLLFKDELGPLIDTWINDHSWSHGFLIPLFSLYLLNQNKKQILQLEPRVNYLGLTALVAVIVFYALNVISPSGYAYFRSISMIGVLGAVVLLLGGWRLLKLTWLPIAYLVFAVPLPRRYYVAITMPMRRWAAWVATALMNLVNDMEATVSGVVISVVYKGRQMEPPLNVAEACSGMRLLMAFVALGVAMAYLHYRPIWQRMILLGSTIPIAILCNIIRVTVTGFIHVFIGPKYTVGIYHDMLGMAMLPLAFIFYGSLSWFLASLFVEDTEIVPDIVVSKRSN